MSARILVADDEPPIVEVLATVLEDEGYAVLRAYDGAAAFAVVERERPALIISDVLMPRMSGLELAERVRETAAELPIVLISAVPPPSVTLAHTTVLAKPFDIEAIVGLVARLLPDGLPDSRCRHS
jgi:CheY-like chemotaxis protein